MKRKTLNRKALGPIALRSFALVVVVAATWQARAQDDKAPYPNMARLSNT